MLKRFSAAKTVQSKSVPKMAVFRKFKGLNIKYSYPHFWNPWPQFAYSLCHFQGATTKIKPCYRRKVAISHCEGYKVHCACAVSRDLCTGGPPKPHVAIFWPRIVYYYTTFMRLRRRLRLFLYWSTSMLKHFSAAKKPSGRNRSPKWRFFGNLRI